MGDLLIAGNAWLGAIRRASMATLRTYRRGGPDGVSVQVLATQGKTDAEQADSNGLLFGEQIVDWLIELTDLVIPAISETPLTPAAGDQIVDTDGTVWEAMPLGINGTVWRWSGPGQMRYRIHTKQVSNS